MLKASLDDPWLSVPITLASSSEEDRAVDDFSDQAGCSDGRASPFAHAATSVGTLQQRLQGQVLPETLPGAQGSVVLPTLCPMCRSRVMSDDEFYDSIRSRGLTGDDYCVDVGESSALEPACCYGCPARAHNRCLGTSRESAHSIDYLHYSSGWYSDPGGWLCPACAPAETRKEKKKKMKGKRGRQ